MKLTYNNYQKRIKDLLKRRPCLHSEVIGHSVLNKPIYAISFGNGPRQVFFNAAHHANEWVTTLVLLRFIDEYAVRCAGTPLYEQATVWFVPMVNPDGVNLVTGGIPARHPAYKEARAMYRELEPFPQGWKANINGVDLNVNYPAGWEAASEIKKARGYTEPGAREYAGPSPLSEPESKAMADFTHAYNFLLTLSFHTQGQEIYWRYGNTEPPRAREIAQMLSLLSGYATADAPAESSHAGYKDWFIQEYNRPGFTIECGLGQNPLPESQLEQIYRENVGILTYSAQANLKQ